MFIGIGIQQKYSIDKMQMDMEDAEKFQPWTEEAGLNDSEIQRYYFHKHFISNPETDSEKLLTAEDLMKAIKSYYNKLHKLEEVFITVSEKVQRSRKLIDWSRTVENEFTIQDVTHAAETYMLEFEMSAVEEKQHDLNLDRKFKGRKEKIKKRKAPVVEKATDVESAKMVPSKTKKTDRRSDEQCVESMMDFYSLGVNMENRILYNWKECDSASPERSSPEKDSPEKYVFQEPSKRIIQERMDFITAYKLMIRATLMLYNRMNSEFVEEAAKVYERESTYVQRKHDFYMKQKQLIKSKSSTDTKSPSGDSSSGTEVNPESEKSSEEKEKMEVDAET